MRRRTNFRTYVLFGNLVLILLPIILIGVWSEIGYQTVIVRSVKRSNELVAAAIAGRLDEFFARPRDAADRIAQLLSRPELYPRDRLNEYLGSILSSWSFFEDIEIIDSSGTIRWLAPFDKAFAGISRAGDTVFESILKSSGTFWSTTYMSLKNNEPALIFGRKSNGYVIQCNLSLRAIDQFAADLSREYGNDFELRITDELGLFVYNADSVKVRQREVQNSFELIRTPRTGPFSLTLDDGGRSYLVSGAATTQPHWYILVFTPVRLAFAPLGDLYLVLGLVLLASAVAGVVYSRLHLRRIVRGFNSLEAGTRRLADGDFAELAGFGEGFLELEKLGESFNMMVASLQKRDAHLREQEEQLSASLREKEVLLKEVHHRVKNNLQLISSFLSLEAMKQNDTSANSPFLQAQRRVRSLALIHESLYDSDLFDRVNFGQYATRLAREIFAQTLDGQVSIVTRLNDVTLTMEKAIPCGMILNEALTNTAKHAFPAGWEGPREIDLQIDRPDPGTARIVLKDSGAGLPPGYDPSAADSLGHTIMKLLARQLGGTLSITSDAGTMVTLTFAG